MVYGSLINRLEEGNQFCDEITVGTGMTEYLYSDRRAYEVIEVTDQKHVTVREYDHKHVGEPFTNDWELISNPNNPTRMLEKRGNVWYWTQTVTAEDVGDIDIFVLKHMDRLPCLIKTDRTKTAFKKFELSVAGFDLENIIAKGKQTKRSKANVSFGKAEYHYDFEF